MTFRNIIMLVLALCTSPFQLFPQLNLQFTSHLHRNQLQSEHVHYLRAIEKSTPQDSIHYAWAKYYLSQNNSKEFISNFDSSGLIFVNDTQAMNIAAAYALRNPTTASSIFSVTTKLESVPSGFLNAKIIFEAAEKPRSSSLVLENPSLQHEFETYRGFAKKKPFIGGLLSAVVPGLGKCYAGRKVSFANVFFAHLLYGITIYESVKKLGIKNPYTIINLSYCGIFYLSNIYGSFMEVKKVKAEKKKQFLLNAARYLDTHSNCSLYPEP